MSGGATETLTLAYSTGITQSTFNNLNELTATSGGGPTRFAGTTNKPIKSANVNSVAATLPTSTSFNASPVLSTGNNSTTVAATDGANNTVTNPYQVSVKGGPSATLTYDANGNMTSDGTNSYAWDAENRMIQIAYPGSGNNSQFTYDGSGRNVSIVETVGGSVTSTKQFVWNGRVRAEQRDSGGTLISQFFDLGQVIGSTNYFYGTDQLDSIWQVTNNSGVIVSARDYDPFGRVTVDSATVAPDFGFAGYYLHARSGLSIAGARGYNAYLGRFMNRDPIEELGGVNLYAYVSNDPISFADPSGLGKAECCRAKSDAADAAAIIRTRVAEQAAGRKDAKTVKGHAKAIDQARNRLEDALRRWRIHCPDKPPQDLEDLASGKAPSTGTAKNSNSALRTPIIPIVPANPGLPTIEIPTIPEIPIPTIPGLPTGVPIFEPFP